MVHQRCVFFLVGLAYLLTLAGCGDPPVTATAPFYAEADVIYDRALEGRWILYGDNQPFGYDEHEAYDPPIKLIFEKPYPSTESQSKPQEKYYNLELQTIGAGNKMKATLFQVAGEQLLDLESSAKSNEHIFLPNLLETHMVLRVKRTGDVLILGYLGKSWVEDQVPADRRNWKQSWEDENPVVLLPTDDLKKLLFQALKAHNAFPGEYRFSRKDSETSARDLVDYGERLMANEFMARGDYASALKAYQEALNARSDNHDTYALLAFMQAANGDAAAARSSISIYVQQCRQVLELGFGSGRCLLIGDEAIAKRRAEWNSLEHELLGLSYFTEADWAQANREFEAAISGISDSTGTSDEQDTLLLLQSLTLAQLGRKAEAARLLHDTQNAMGESGKVLAEYLLGQIKDEDLLDRLKAKQKSWHEHECNTECRADFFIASRHLAEGDGHLAQQWFQTTLETKEFVGVEPVIARLRLKKLDRQLDP